MDIRIRWKAFYPSGYPTGKPDSDHLWETVQDFDVSRPAYAKPCGSPLFYVSTF